MARVLCQNCKTAVEVAERVGFNETCPSCGAWLHSCVHCRFWSGGQCLEPSAEKMSDPEGKNFCEWYCGIGADSADGKEKTGGKDAAEEMWRKLTGKKE